MPHGFEVRGYGDRVLFWLVVGIGLLVALALETTSLAAQERLFGPELSLKRDYPGSGPSVCTDVSLPAPPLESDRLQARQLASSADQALLLGDLSRAATLLARAVEFDPSSADLAYRRARVLQNLGERVAALDAYCRALSGDLEGETATDAQARIRTLADARWAGISEDAASAFRLGLSAADLRRFDDAAESFGTAVDAAPLWADAAFNRGLMYDRLGEDQRALADLRRYLELAPDAVDAVEVSVRIGQLEGASAATRSAGTALTLGLIVPGMGQFYSGREFGGSVVLSLAGGAVAAGLLIKDVEVECFVTVGAGEDCPAGQVFRENVDRPYLMPALGVAAGVALIGAIEAFVKARRGPPAAGPLTPAPSPGELRLAWPSLTQQGNRVDLNLLRLTF